MLKQPLQKNQNCHLLHDFPKLPITSIPSNDRFVTPSSKTKYKQKQINKQNMSPVKVKQFVKLFQNSNSNTRILKISPYCNNMLKNKLISALELTAKQKQKHLLPYKNKTKRGPMKFNRFGHSVDILTEQNLNEISSKLKSDYSRDLSKHKSKNNCKLLTIQIFHQEIQIQINQRLYNENKSLDSTKIIKNLLEKVETHKFSKKLNTIVGFRVIQLKTNKEDMEKSKDKQERKGFLEATTYLLSIGKLKIVDSQYQKYDNFILKPIFPKRMKQFIENNKNDTTIKNIMLCDFDIIKCLGSGGFSSVFLARGNFNNKYYAMKLIEKSFILESERDGIIQNQRYILETLSKRTNQKEQRGVKFITQLSFCFQTVSHFIFMIQYCPGGQLFNQLKKVRKMTQDQAKFYFLQILIALDYIHSRSIIYRDLKPQNLLIDTDGHIKIADFGLSKPLENFKSFSYSFCGSPEYMAPEMLTKSGHNHLLDYYCLGALLYELVIGVPPYYSLKQQQIYESILTEQLSFPKNVELSSEIMNLLSGLLKKDTKTRLGSLYGVKQIMCHPWIGRINRATIQNRQLIPPFVPDLNLNNFDPEQIKVDIPQIMERLKSDSKKRQFQTHFSEQFTYINPRQKLTFLQNYQMVKELPLSHTPRQAQILKSCTLNNRNRFSSPFSIKNLLYDKQNSVEQRSQYRRQTSKPKNKDINKFTINISKGEKQKKKLINKKYVSSLR